MTKVRFHGPIAGFSGAMGEMVFADQGKRTVAYMKKHREPSEAQVSWYERWKEAAAYAKSVMGDAAKREFYSTIAAEKDIPLFALAMGDYLNEPSFKPLELDQYRGEVGNPILIRAGDDIGLVSVEVALSNVDGSEIEKGMAVESGLRSGYWVYTATQAVPLSTDIFIEVVGIDHIGRKVKITENPIVGAVN
jgi:hypothetical protein